MTMLQEDISLMKILEDKETPHNAPLSARYKRSFAYPSMNERAPVILTKIIDFMARDKKNIIQNYGENAEEELKAVIGEISQLKNHLQTAKPFQEFTSKSPDSDLWNSELTIRKARADPLNYYESDWLFAECYLYRRIRECFATKVLLNSFDPFSYQKNQVLNQSIDTFGVHLKRIYDEQIFESSRNLSEGELRSQLAYLIKCSLWANRMDLSLSGGSTDMNINILDQVKDWDENIIIDHIDAVCGAILKDNGLDQIDFVTDNGGLELLNDLVLADFLVSRCGVKKLRFRLKPMPWYVSDVTLSDFNQTIDKVFCSPINYYKYFGARWRKFVDSGVWQLSAENFWCLGLPYSEMSQKDPTLFAELKASDLVIFKGDLNYRKLVQDRNWHPTKPFYEALGDFSPITLVALRTNKADTISGLKPGLAEDISSRAPNWLISGEFGIIQFNIQDCCA